MSLLLTLLTVAAAVALLGTLVFGLLFILKPLQSVRRSLRDVAMGVRAIEHHTRPLGDRALALGSDLGDLGVRPAAVASRLAGTPEAPAGDTAAPRERGAR